MGRYPANPFNDAEAFWRASDYDGSGTLIDASGNGHNAQLGSTAGSDANDPTFLAHDGTNYVWFPGAGANTLLYASVPQSRWIDTTTTHVEFIWRCAADDWTLGDKQGVIGTHNTLPFYVHRTAADQWQVSISDNGVPTLMVFAAGADPITLVNGTAYWWRFTWNQVSGAFEFFYSTETENDPDNVTWVSFETGTVGAGTAPYAYTTAADDLYIGAVNQAGTWNWPGKIDFVEVRFDGVLAARYASTDIEPSRTALDLDGTGDYATIPDEDALSPTGDHTFIVDAAMDDWTLASGYDFWLVKGTAYEYAYGIQAPGNLYAQIGATGQVTSALSFTDGSRNQVKAVYTAAAGTVDWYLSSDGGATWAFFEQLTGFPTSITPDAGTVHIGASAAGANPAAGQIFSVQLIDDGTTVLDVDFTDQTPGAATVTASTGQTVTLVADAAIVPDGQLRIHDSTPTYLNSPGATNDRAIVPSTAALNLANTAFTLELRGLVVPDRSPVAAQMVLTKDDVSGNGRSWDLSLAAGAGEAWSLDTFDEAGGWLGAITTTNEWVGEPGERFDLRITFDGSAWYKAYNRLSGGTWAQFGADIAATTKICANSDGTASLGILGRANGTSADASVERVLIYTDDTQTTLILDADFTDLAPGVTSFTEDSDNAATVTMNGNAAIAGGSNKWDVNRASSGLVTTLVEEPMFVFDGVDDYMIVPDHADLDFNATDDFTLLIAFRSHFIPAANKYQISKRTSGGLPAWILVNGAVTGAPIIDIYDSAADRAFDIGLPRVASSYSVSVGRVDRSLEEAEGFLNGVGSGSPADTTAVGTLENAGAVWIGQYIGGGAYADTMEFTAAALWRRALTDTEILLAYTLLNEAATTRDTDWILELGDLSVDDIAKLASLAGVTPTSGEVVGKLNQIAGRDRSAWTEYRSALTAAAAAAGITWP